MSFLSNLFSGFNFGQSNQNNSWTTQQIGNTFPEWIDTTNKWVLYKEIPELQAVINRYSKMIASANPIICDKKGNVIDPDNHWIFKLIDRPNAMQSWGNMMYMAAINKCVTNNILVFAPQGMMGNRQNLTPLAWNNIKIVGTGKDLRQTTIGGFIEKFQIPSSVFGQFTDYLPNELIYISEPDGINLYNSVSKIDALKYPLSNIAAQYRKRNVLLNNLFALGILSMKLEDGISSKPLMSPEKEQMRKDIKARHNGEIVITDRDMNWNPMSFPTRDLMLFEELTADKVALIDQFGLNQNMFGSADSKGSTFSNVEMGEKQAYNSTIIPDTEIIYDEFTKQLGLDKQGLYLKPDFKHISVLQSDDNKTAQALLSKAQALDKIALHIKLNDKEMRSLLGI